RPNKRQEHAQYDHLQVCVQPVPVISSVRQCRDYLCFVDGPRLLLRPLPSDGSLTWSHEVRAGPQCRRDFYSPCWREPCSRRSPSSGWGPAPSRPTRRSSSCLRGSSLSTSRSTLT